MSSFLNEFDSIITQDKEVYRLHANAPDSETIIIRIVNRDYTKRWQAEFSSAYIEDITNKSGGSKKLSVFWRMLCNSANSISQSVKIEILDNDSLQKMSSLSKLGVDSKLYLILVQSSEFETIKYPLPIPSSPYTNEELISTVRRLYNENERLQASLEKIDTTNSIHSLERRLTEMNALMREVQLQKDEEISNLQSRISKLHNKSPPRTPQPKSFDHLNFTSRPKMMHKENNEPTPRKKVVSRSKRSNI